eukprot:15132746-Ditylum_brightwellii.AAC.1
MSWMENLINNHDVRLKEDGTRMHCKKCHIEHINIKTHLNAAVSVAGKISAFFLSLIKSSVLDMPRINFNWQKISKACPGIYSKEIQLQQLFIKYRNHLGNQFSKTLVMTVFGGKSATFARKCT